MVSGLPGDAERLLEESANMGHPIHVGDVGGTRKDRSQRRRSSFASSGGPQSSEMHPTTS